MTHPSEISSLEILFSVSRELASSLDLHVVLERVLTLSTTNIGAESASLIVLDEKGNPLDAAMILNGKLTPTTTEQMRDVITSGLAGWVIRNRQEVRIEDTSKDERWLLRPGEILTRSSGKSALCIPVMAQEKLVGVLTIVHPGKKYFTAADQKLQRAIADLAGIAVRNAELYQDVQNTQIRYFDLFEENSDPIFITDLRGNIIEANLQAGNLTGFPKSQLLNRSILNLHEPVLKKIGQHFELIPDKEPLTYESNLKVSQKGNLPVEVRVSRIQIAEEPCIQWIFRDYQEQKQLIQLRDDLSAMLYHDLRSPLANIISSLDIMANLMPLMENESLKSVFDIARRSTERMQRMIDGLLDISRLEAGQKIIKTLNSRLDMIINDAVEMIQSAAISKSIVISKTIPQNLPEVRIDDDMIRRVILNLLENAVKFSPSGSSVKITVSQTPEELWVAVDDQGNGIPDEVQPDIFEKFVRLKQQSPIKGMGLGLAFCKLAVQAHGGTIGVKNLPQGGSQFAFSLPLYQQE